MSLDLADFYESVQTTGFKQFFQNYLLVYEVYTDKYYIFFYYVLLYWLLKDKY